MLKITGWDFFSSSLSLLDCFDRYSFMRRNVRRLNREIGNHGSSLPVSTQVSLPLTLPTSYQPRSLEKKIINNMKTVVGQQPSFPPEPTGGALYNNPPPVSPSSTSSVSETPSSTNKQRTPLTIHAILILLDSRR